MIKGFEILNSYGNYMIAVAGKSSRTVQLYRYDIIMFFRRLKIDRGLVPKTKPMNDISVEDIDAEIIGSVTPEEILGFLVWLNDSHLKSTSRARRIASLRSFFHYCYKKKRLISSDPTDDIENPKLPVRQPAYLTLEESQELLKTAYDAPTMNSTRDYCMLVLFINCGMRLSELRGIDIDHIKDTTLRVIGKGNKERTVYLNPSCLEAIEDWLYMRNSIKIHPEAQNALFVSKFGNRISDDAVQYAIKRLFALAGLDTNKFSVHKLRHTAATLMYKYGHVDIRSLQAILGHNSVSTTQIYTHVDNEQLQEAVNSNPLANFDPED